MENNYFKSRKIAKHILDVMHSKANPEHEVEFDEWLHENRGAVGLADEFGDSDKLSKKLSDLQSVDRGESVEKLLSKILIEEKKRSSNRRKRIILWSAASSVASVIFLFFAWNYVAVPFRTTIIEREEMKLAESIALITPANNAILVLESGETIDLHSTMDGVIANTTAKNAVKYDEAAIKIPNNTLITPVGVTYHVTLSDGTTVWLNENSKLVYPVKFEGKQRIVSLEGEAYFEVQGNKDIPFVVNSQNDSKVKVLGTKFNINTKEDKTYTTLVEGSVEVLSKDSKIVIKPSEQAIVSRESNNIIVSEVDVHRYIAWKDGKYVFVDEKIINIMKKISTWYNVDIEYDNNELTPNIELSGSLKKFETLQKAIEVMEATNLIEIKVKNGNRIKIYAKK